MSHYFEYNAPRRVKGGIKARFKQNGHKNWWAERWIKTLEDFEMGARLGRGREYANKGQVKSLKIKKGSVTAKVQGSRRIPYNVTIKVKMLNEQDWSKLTQKFAEPSIAADLLIGRMPDYIERIFDDNRLSLFPSKIEDLDTKCTCPDWANPCKHIAAVYILLGDEFDSDPFLIFRLRGIERDELLEVSGFKPSLSIQTAIKNDDKEESIHEPLPTDIDKFWGDVKQQQDHRADPARIPEMHAALVQQLGRFPFWQSDDDFMSTMKRVYREASSRGLDVAIGKRQNVETKKSKTKSVKARRKMIQV